MNIFTVNDRKDENIEKEAGMVHLKTFRSFTEVKFNTSRLS